MDGIAASNFIVQEDRGLVMDAATSERISIWCASSTHKRSRVDRGPRLVCRLIGDVALLGGDCQRFVGRLRHIIGQPPMPAGMACTFGCGGGDHRLEHGGFLLLCQMGNRRKVAATLEPTARCRVRRRLPSGV